MASLRVVAAAVAVLATRAEECVEPICSYMPCETGKKVGTCRILGCSGKHGPTDCIDGKCFCAEGTCAGDDGFTCNIEQPMCQKLVGTCRIFGCNKKHGATDCIDGKCLCAEGTCSVDGVTCVAAGVAANVTELSEADVKELSSEAAIARLEAKVEHLSAQLEAHRGEGGASPAALALFGAVALVSPVAAATAAWAARRGRSSSSREALLVQ